MKIKRDYLDDYAAMEADTLLTSILYTRVKTSDVKWNILANRVDDLKSKIYNQK